MAVVAVDVLTNYLNHDKVQSMVKHILGDDDELPGKINKAKGKLPLYLSYRCCICCTNMCLSDQT